MAARYFPTRDLAWLVQQFRLAEAEASLGKSTISAGAGDVSSGSQIQMSIGERMRRLYHDMSILDSTTYPADGLKGGVTTTRAVFADDFSHP